MFYILIIIGFILNISYDIEGFNKMSINAQYFTISIFFLACLLCPIWYQLALINKNINKEK